MRTDWGYIVSLRVEGVVFFGHGAFTSRPMQGYLYLCPVSHSLLLGWLEAQTFHRSSYAVCTMVNVIVLRIAWLDTFEMSTRGQGRFDLFFEGRPATPEPEIRHRQRSTMDGSALERQHARHLSMPSSQEPDPIQVPHKVNISHLFEDFCQWSTQALRPGFLLLLPFSRVLSHKYSLDISPLIAVSLFLSPIQKVLLRSILTSKATWLVNLPENEA